MATLTDKTVANTYDQLWFRGATEPGATDNAVQVLTTENDGTDDLATPLYLGTARIGIGTSSPTVELDVVGAMKVDSTTLVVNAVGYTDRVGIGTATPAYLTHIKGVETGEGTALGQLAIQSSTVYGSTPDAGIIFINEHTTGSQAIMGGIKVTKSNTGDGDLDSTMTLQVRKHGAVAFDALTINEDGQVGIGTDTPGNNLEVKSVTGSNAYIRVNTTDSDDSTSDAGILLAEAGTNKWNLYNDGSDSDKLKLNDKDGDTWITILQDTGNVGIGTTSPDSLLHISGTSSDTDWDDHAVISSTTPSLLIANSTNTADTFSSMQMNAKEASNWQSFAIISQATTAGTSLRGTYSPKVYFAQRVAASGENTMVAAMTIDEDAKVGIGTSSPDSQLDIEGSSSTTLSSRQGASASLAGAGNVLRIANTSATTGGYSALELVAKEGGGGGINCTAYIAGMSVAGEHEAELHFGRRNASGTSTTSMMIDKAGNVGIGTESPEAPLHVIGANVGAVTLDTEADDFCIENTTTPGMTILGNNNATGSIFFGFEDDSNIGRIQYDHSANKMTFTTNNDKTVSIDNAGNVGIGTDSPDTSLHVKQVATGQIMQLECVNGTTNTAGPTLILERSYNGDGVDNGKLGVIQFNGPDDGTPTIQEWASIRANINDASSDTEDGTLDFYNTINATETLVMTLDAGKVGIGTASPISPLEIWSASGGHAFLNIWCQNSVSGDPVIRFGGRNDTSTAAVTDLDWGIGLDRGANKLAFLYDASNGVTEAASDQLMVIDSSGDVGIGAAAPATNLHIYKDIGTTSGSLTQIRTEQDTDADSTSTDIGVYYHATQFDTNATGVSFIKLESSDNQPMYFWLDDGDEFRASSSIGNIGTTTGQDTDEVMSDERLKNISSEDFPYGLKEILELKPISYTLKDSSNTKNRLGLGAQTSKKIVPELVGDSGQCIDGYKKVKKDDGKGNLVWEHEAIGDESDTKLSMKYYQVIPILIKAVQELSAEVEKLKNG